MPKSVDDLKAIRDQLRKRRAEVASEITGDMDHSRIDDFGARARLRLLQSSGGITGLIKILGSSK